MTIKSKTPTKRKTTPKKTNETQEHIEKKEDAIIKNYHSFKHEVLTKEDFNAKICDIVDDNKDQKTQRRLLNEFVSEQQIQINNVIDETLDLLANTQNRKAENLNVLTIDLIPTGKSKNFFREVVVNFHEKNSDLIDMSSGDTKNALKLEVDCLRSFINMRLNQDQSLLPIVEDANRKAGYEMIGGKFDSKGKYTTASKIA